MPICGLLLVIGLLPATGCGPDASGVRDAGTDGGVDGGDGGGLPLPEVVVDTGIVPSESEMLGFEPDQPRPLAALVDEDGVETLFAERDLVLQTDDPGVLDAFRERWEAEVLSSVDPAEHGFPGLAPVYLLRINTGLADPGALPGELRALDPEATGRFRVSSPEGLGLLAAAVHELSGGLAVGVDWQGRGCGFLDGHTTEAPVGTAGFTDGSPDYNPDAYTWNYLNAGSLQNFGVAEAWTAMARLGLLGNRVEIGIIDGGFSPNPDFPEGEAYSLYWYREPLNEENPGSCASSCPWHGTKVTASAMALPDNGFGTAGPAGPVGRPILVVARPGWYTNILAINKARENGARIINMSWSGRMRNAWKGTLRAFKDLIARMHDDHDVIFFAAAGNDGRDVNLQYCGNLRCWDWEKYVHFPCEFPEVICVGGLGQNQLVRDDSSNYAGDANRTWGTVDIYGPFTLLTGVDVIYPDPPVNQALQGRGTSYSSPFTAGVAALVWSIDPNMPNTRVEDILMGTRQPYYSFERLDAQAAVLAAVGSAVAVENPAEGSSFHQGIDPVTFRAWVFEGGRGSATVSWTSDRQADPVCIGNPCESRQLELGNHAVTARAAFSDGYEAESRPVNISILNDPPRMTIILPWEQQTVYQNTSIDLLGTSFDANTGSRLPDDKVSWWMDDAAMPFFIGHEGSAPIGSTALGTHVVRLVGSDGQELGSDQVNIFVEATPANLPPVVSIASPANMARYQADQIDPANDLYYAPVLVVGHAEDPEGETLDPSAYAWTDSVDGGPPRDLGTGTVRTVWLHVESYPTSEHRLTLTVTDSGGAAGHYTILVYVEQVI